MKAFKNGEGYRLKNKKHESCHLEFILFISEVFLVLHRNNHEKKSNEKILFHCIMYYIPG